MTTTRRSFLGALLAALATPRELVKRLTSFKVIKPPVYLHKKFTLGFLITPEMLEDDLMYPINLGALTAMDIHSKQYLADAMDRLEDDDVVDADYEADEEDDDLEEDDDDYTDDDLQEDLERSMSDDEDEDEDDEETDVADEDEFTDADLDEDDLDDED